ncbi:leucyl aminopeptidase [Patescibacteria group bacterium]|nr:leucyl aminopeptidase [Patescibacteria group bacterium]
MRFTFNNEPKGSFSSDVYALGVWHSDKISLESTEISNEIKTAVLQDLKRRSWTGKEGETLLFPILGLAKYKYLLIVGLGEKRNFKEINLRTVGAKLIKATSSHQLKTLSVDYNVFSSAKDLAASLQFFTEGVLLASYQFTAFKKHTAKDELKKKTIDQIFLPSGSILDKKTMEKGIELGNIYAEATCLARDMVNTPSMQMHPDQMVKIAQDLSGRGTSITCKVRGRDEMAKLGMHASLAVGQGSVHEPKFVHLIYKPKKVTKNTKKIVLVGKAVTFDSGGLNLKPDNGITDMKIDMAGAATVLGVFKALPHIKPNTEVHGLFIAVENMPGGNAYRPGDVISAMDGTTIEVENTDAEGRITLADALAYASLKIKPDQIIDLATLTGAVIIALGSEITGMLGNDVNLKKALFTSAKKSGEYVWELPMHPAYKETIKSKIADIKNVGGRPAGVITAAQFLERFTHKVPWVHLDIAGPCYAEKESRPEWTIGGTGWGVRTLLYLINQ